MRWVSRNVQAVQHLPTDVCAGAGGGGGGGGGECHTLTHPIPLSPLRHRSVFRNVQELFKLLCHACYYKAELFHEL